MKIAYLTVHDPYEPSSWSGTNYYMFKSLEAEGLDVTHVGKSYTKVGIYQNCFKVLLIVSNPRIPFR